MKNWNDLPGEIKEIVVFHSTRDTRNSLSCCSKLDYQLVKNMVRIKEATKLDLVHDCKLSIDFSGKFPEFHGFYLSFDDFQSTMALKMKELSSIKEFKLYLIERRKKEFLKLLTDEDRECRRLRNIEEIHITIDDKDRLLDFLRQMEPIFLRKVRILSIESNEQLYNMQQIVNAEEVKLFIQKNSMTENHLLNLKARLIHITDMKFSANQFIKKCLVEANVKFHEFELTFEDFSFVEELLEEWHFPAVYRFCAASSLRFVNFSMVKKTFNQKKVQKELILDTPYPHLKLEMVLDGLVLKGSIVIDSEKTASIPLNQDRFALRIINKLHIQFDSVWGISVTRLDKPTRFYCFESVEEARKKIDEILENADIIKDFTIKDPHLLVFKRYEKKFLVRRLVVEGLFIEGMLRSLLEQCEPGYLKTFDMTGVMTNKDLFDWPQITNVSDLRIMKNCLEDEQLLKMNAVTIRTFCPAEEFCLSERSLNLFLKKCLLDLNVKDYDIRFDTDDLFDMYEKVLYQDLTYIPLDEPGDEPDGDFDFTVIINSDFPEYVLAADVGSYGLKIKRELREEYDFF